MVVLCILVQDHPLLVLGVADPVQVLKTAQLLGSTQSVVSLLSKRMGSASQVLCLCCSATISLKSSSERKSFISKFLEKRRLGNSGFDDDMMIGFVLALLRWTRLLLTSCHFFFLI